MYLTKAEVVGLSHFFNELIAHQLLTISETEFKLVNDHERGTVNYQLTTTEKWLYKIVKEIFKTTQAICEESDKKFSISFLESAWICAFLKDQTRREQIKTQLIQLVKQAILDKLNRAHDHVREAMDPLKVGQLCLAIDTVREASTLPAMLCVYTELFGPLSCQRAYEFTQEQWAEYYIHQALRPLIDSQFITTDDIEVSDKKTYIKLIIENQHIANLIPMYFKITGKKDDKLEVNSKKIDDSNIISICYDSIPVDFFNRFRDQESRLPNHEQRLLLLCKPALANTLAAVPCLTNLNRESGLTADSQFSSVISGLGEEERAILQATNLTTCLLLFTSFMEHYQQLAEIYPIKPPPKLISDKAKDLRKSRIAAAQTDKGYARLSSLFTPAELANMGTIKAFKGDEGAINEEEDDEEDLSPVAAAAAKP